MASQSHFCVTFGFFCSFWTRLCPPHTIFEKCLGWQSTKLQPLIFGSWQLVTKSPKS
jgi:hypothetical protein